jgi:hypothetical protein
MEGNMEAGKKERLNKWRMIKRRRIMLIKRLKIGFYS